MTAAGPFAHQPISVRTIMVLVMIALCPATAWSLLLFGWPAINLLAAHRLIGKRSLLGASEQDDEEPEADDLEDDIIAPEEAE